MQVATTALCGYKPSVRCERQAEGNQQTIDTQLLLVALRRHCDARPCTSIFGLCDRVRGPNLMHSREHRAFWLQGQNFDSEYYKGLVSSSLDQRYTRDAAENSDVDMLSRNIKLGLYTVGALVALVVAFLWSNGVI